jgi:hypothetical protein
MEVSRVLTASGVPNDNGRLRWPTALQVLGGPESGNRVTELRDRLDSLFSKAAEQAARGPADPKVLEEINRAVKQLRELVIRDQEERGGLAESDYEKAKGFLHKLKDAEAVLRVGVKVQGARSR